MPTQGASNPALTISANTARVADYLTRNARTGIAAAAGAAGSRQPMKTLNRLLKFVAAPIAVLFAVYLAQGLIRRPSWRANIIWSFNSWWHPADREASWEQSVGEWVNPWDKVMHGRGAGGPAGPALAAEVHSRLPPWEAATSHEKEAS